MENRVGQQLGNYRLIRLLGQGGFADVYLGQHKILQTHVAIKVMNARLSQAELEKFVQEARTIANLKHPAIVHILDFDVADNTTPFLVMDHAPYGTLRQLHPTGSQVPLATVVSYVQQVAAALQYAHNQKLIHRDVKPENMLIGSNYEIVLSDFGIAVVAHSTRSRKVEDIIGTWTYAAPELFRGTPHPATDQYALAIVAYEWLCGTPPFQGEFPAQYHQHMNVPVPPLRQKMLSIPPAVEQVILTALAKDPHSRFDSVSAFANAFKQASQFSSRSVAAPTVMPPVAPTTYPLPTIAPRAGRIALVQGLIFGVILAVLEIILSFAGQYIGGFSTLLVYVLYLGVPVIAGFRASAQTGKVSTGLLAGLYTGLFASIISGIVSLIYTFINVDSLRQTIQRAVNQANTNLTVTNGYVITFAIISGIVLIILAMVLGLAGGSIGGAFGRRRATVQAPTYQESMFQAPPTNYPSANYPPQNYPPPPQNYPPPQQ